MPPSSATGEFVRVRHAWAAATVEDLVRAFVDRRVVVLDGCACELVA